jgi:hypothetical protein
MWLKSQRDRRVGKRKVDDYLEGLGSRPHQVNSCQMASPRSLTKETIKKTPIRREKFDFQAGGLVTTQNSDVYCFLPTTVRLRDALRRALQGRLASTGTIRMRRAGAAVAIESGRLACLHLRHSPVVGALAKTRAAAEIGSLPLWPARSDLKFTL